MRAIGDVVPETELTWDSSRACIACRKIKMRCIPDDSSGPGGPCKVGRTHQTTSVAKLMCA
jgi:hypothetical protein